MDAEKSHARWLEKQALLSTLKSASPPSIPWAEIGILPTDVDEWLTHLVCVFVVIDRATRRPFTVKSDFARTSAMHVAMAASDGLITTQVDDNIYGRRWLITPLGKEVKEAINAVLKDAVCGTNTYH